MSSEVEAYLKDLEQPDEATVKEAQPAEKEEMDAREKGPPWTHYSKKPIKYKNGRVYGRWRISVTGACGMGGLMKYIDEAAIIKISDYPKPCSDGKRLVACKHN